ncbi:hypothetical protein [Sphingomonas paeninsulae]|uniref:hypothetical protein n=1 Tax=Sphingomonas paeninsulae TaxID=2319844 RepID=UPI001969957D|nr:hypothetical protein [Sphingomonas paeninsulae]
MKNGTVRTIARVASRRAIAMLLVLGASAATAQMSESEKQPTDENYDQILNRLGDGLLENLGIRGEHNARTDSRAKKRFYTNLKPMDAYPAYQPKQQVSGTIRVSGLCLLTMA